MSEPKIKNVRTGPAPKSDETALDKTKLRSNETVDVNGRKIVVRRLDALQKMRLTKLGGADSNNIGYMTYVMLAAAVESIDDNPEPFPQTMRAVEAIVAQLGEEGLEAVALAMGELNGINLDAAGVESAKN
jgi:hypothetical protein